MNENRVKLLIDKIEEQMEFLENNPDIVLVHSNSIKVDENDKEIGFLDYSSKENSGNIFKSIINTNISCSPLGVGGRFYWVILNQSTSTQPRLPDL